MDQRNPRRTILSCSREMTQEPVTDSGFHIGSIALGFRFH